MRHIKRRLEWIRNGLFWRTFILLTFLTTASMMAWFASYSIVERGPQSEQLAAQIVSVVTITRAALTHSAPEMRRELLFDLASNEGIRIYPLEQTDVISEPEETLFLTTLRDHVKQALDEDTRFASSVNGVDGFWISFRIEDDDYWLMLDRGRINRTTGLQWLGWGSIALSLSLMGAAFISTLINQPLARLTAAARAIAKGLRPGMLPESGATEIREANRSFNQMVADLERVESDRTLILAGISHDLRTPLARMQLEVELAHLSDDARSGMQSDLAQMDAIIGQFLDYAKPSDPSNFEVVDLSALIADTASTASRATTVQVTSNIAKNIEVMGITTELQRVSLNLIENARRYGKKAGAEFTQMEINCRAEGSHAIVEIIDRGDGVPENDIDRLQRPFTRLDSARSQANGAGLGLAIVHRIILRHKGKLILRNRDGGGLIAQITLPLNPRPTKRGAGSARQQAA
jgi:two-component system osmolarity sensor histidine kinase EnvZ